MRFSSFFSGGFITAIVVNPPERKLAKRTSVQWDEIGIEGDLCNPNKGQKKVLILSNLQKIVSNHCTEVSFAC